MTDTQPRIAARSPRSRNRPARSPVCLAHALELLRPHIRSGDPLVLASAAWAAYRLRRHAEAVALRDRLRRVQPALFRRKVEYARARRLAGR